MNNQPHSIEAECAVLGSILLDPYLLDIISSLTLPDDFFLEKHELIFTAMLSLHDKNIPPDLITLSEELNSKLDKCGGPAYLTRLINETPTASHGEYYANIVHSKALLRKMISAAAQLVKNSHRPDAEVQEIIQEAEEMLSEVSAKNGGQFKSIKSGLEALDKRIEILTTNPKAIIGLPTGLVDLDKLLGGLQKEDLILLAGRPGMGKSSLAIQIGRTVAKQNKNVALVSLEMGDISVSTKLVSMESGIDSQRLKLGQIKEDEWGLYLSALESLSHLGLFIDDNFGRLTANGLHSYAKRLHDQIGLDLLIIDYLQLMSGERRDENRQQEISAISRSIKQLARELKIPILALSQLSREVEKRGGNKRPRLSDLRESGSLEQDADIVMFIYRDEIYNPDTEFPDIAEIIVDKHRSGPTGIFSLYFKKSTTEFRNLEVRTTSLNERTNGREPSPHFADQL